MGQRRIKFLFLFFNVLLVFALSGQTAAVSGNGKLLLRLSESTKDRVTGQHIFTSSLYGKAQKSLLHRFDISSNDASDPLEIRLNYNGKLLYLSWKNDYRIYNALTGVLLFRFKSPIQVSLSHNDNFFIVSTELWIKAFDAYTGEELQDYLTAPINYIRKLVLTENDEHLFAVTDRKQILVWEIGREKPRKKYFSDDVSIGKNSFTLKRVTGPTVSIYQYQLPDFKRLEKVSVNKLLRDYAKDKTETYRNNHPEDRRAIIRPSEIIAGQVFLNQNGEKLSVFVETPEEQKGLIVAEIANEKVILDEIVGDLKSNVAQEWYNDSLLIPRKDAVPKVFNANKKRFEDNLDYFIKNGNAKSADNNNLKVSPNFQFTVEQTKGGIILRQQGRDQRLELNQFVYLGFSPKSSRLFLENSVTGLRGYFELENFGKKGSFVVYFSEEEYPNTEMLMPEPKTPLGKRSDKITAYKHISEATDGDSLRIIMKSLVAGKEAGLQMQIIDQNGVYYYGAGAPDWRNFWCNLMVKGSDGKVRQVEDFKVTEHRTKESVPNAVSLVVDFSGSMGWPRADALQDGVERFIQSKKESDKISLFKYDQRVVKESKPIDNKDRLIRRLFRSDFSSFGGSTALLDAIDAGIHSVKSVRNVSKKIVIVFTDGIENASLTTRNEVVARAIENGVSIYTVAFGDMVDVNYLKSIAYSTRGGFYQTFNVKDFEWLFQDIYAKAENYYSVKYDTEDKGSQVQVLKICKDNLQTADSLAVEFTNDPKDIEMLLDNDNLYIDNPVTYEGRDVDAKLFFYRNKTPEKMTFLTPKGVEYLVIDDDLETTIEDEFDKIDLPSFNFKYDKTNTVTDTEARIKQLLDFAAKYPDVKLMISGHTDNQGSLEYNDKLSLRRANMVRDVLIERGIAPERLFVEGVGELSPIATNDTPEGRAQNRRVEFRIIEDEEIVEE